MKLIAKKLLCLALLLTLLVSVVACGGSDQETSRLDSEEGSSQVSDGPAVDPETQYLDENGNYVTKLGVLDEYKDRTFTVVVRGEYYGTYQSDDFTTATAGNGGIDYGDAYYGEVKARNDKIEEDYDIELVVEKIENPRVAIEEDAQSGGRMYDAAVIHVVEDAAVLAQNDLLCNLYSLKNFDYSAPWWDASANEAYSIGDKLYFTTGDITIMNKANTWCILFNKEMVTNYGLENPYEMFRNNTWTFDKLAEMASTVHNAAGPEDMENPDAVFGMVTAYGDALEFYGGSGMTLCSKDAQNNPSLAFGESEASVNLAETVLTNLRNADWKIYAQTPNVGMQPAFKLFWTGRALFRPSGFTAVTKCRSLAEIEIGILPMPRVTETQDGYYTTSTGTFVACIPKNCKDPEYSAYMLDAFAAGAKNYITPAYIEVNLKQKSLRDNDSEEILEYIYSHIIYDVGRVYNFGKVTSVMFYLARDNSSDIVSSMDGIRETINIEIEDLIFDYESNET